MAGGINSGPLQTSQPTPGLSAYLVIPGRDTVQAVILLQQVDGLAQETERGRAQGFREGQGQTQSYSDTPRAGDGTQKSCPLVLPLKSPVSFSIDPFNSLLQPNTCHSTFAQTLPPPFELASSRKLSKTPHCLLPWRPSQAKRPHAAYRSPPHLKKSTAMSRSSSKTTANLASCSRRGTT